MTGSATRFRGGRVRAPPASGGASRRPLDAQEVRVGDGILLQRPEPLGRPKPRYGTGGRRRGHGGLACQGRTGRRAGGGALLLGLVPVGRLRRHVVRNVTGRLGGRGDRLGPRADDVAIVGRRHDANAPSTVVRIGRGLRHRQVSEGGVSRRRALRRRRDGNGQRENGQHQETRDRHRFADLPPPPAEHRTSTQPRQSGTSVHLPRPGGDERWPALGPGCGRPHDASAGPTAPPRGAGKTADGRRRDPRYGLDPVVATGCMKAALRPGPRCRAEGAPHDRSGSCGPDARVSRGREVPSLQDEGHGQAARDRSGLGRTVRSAGDGRADARNHFA
ncbi:hypothetical protein LKMONMHP_1400 [Methylobacterium organophilum]|uniref:Uncharacterized protein n=1 Tax=Methylobacterium organophilum TaxID=410 RepID=A0ABQ4T6E6_METOR|nr:hypothetical protein LKMONMHP_1400 [Methylobacterium organophilum]